MKIKIYSGLSLSAAEITHHLPDAMVCPPVRRGDVEADAAAGVHVIGIVDGEFFQNFAVTPSEILRALRVGVRIYGASSMGALRAAELDRYGMTGCGQIYQQICAQPYFCDDHLGLIFSGEPESANRAQASMTMIDFLATLQKLSESGRLNSQLASRLQQYYARLHFSERNLDRLAEVMRATEADSAELMQAWQAVHDNAVNQKQLDGLALLAQIRHDLELVAQQNSLLHA